MNDLFALPEPLVAPAPDEAETVTLPARVVEPFLRFGEYIERTYGPHRNEAALGFAGKNCLTFGHFRELTKAAERGR